MLRDQNPAADLSVIDLRISKQLPPSSNIKYVAADITDKQSISRILGQLKPQVLIHTASPAQVGKTAPPKSAAALYQNVNVNGTKNLLDVCQSIGVKAFVYCSSGSVLGDTDGILRGADETTKGVPADQQKDPYSRSKTEAETLVLEFNGTGGMLTCAIRPVGIFGEGDVQTIPGTIEAFRNGQAGYQLGNNDNIYDFTYVDNVAYGHVLAASALMRESSGQADQSEAVDSRVQGEAFFINNDEPMYFWDFIRTIWITAGYEPPTRPWIIGRETGMFIASLMTWIYWLMGKPPKIDKKTWSYAYMSRYCNSSKAKARLGWRPLVGVKEGIQRTVKDFLEKEQRDLTTK